MFKTYQIKRAKVQPSLDGDFSAGPWNDVEALEIDNFMGDEPCHKPRTLAKALYDDEFVYVIFRVEDKYVRAVSQKFHDPVCQDSCVEFFFTPGGDASVGYFNVEINCGGTLLCFHQLGRDVDTKELSEDDCRSIEIYHSEDKIVDPERQGDCIWTVEYRLPINMLAKYCSIEKPAPGVKWRGNFYKCADETSHPHWLTWSVVDRPAPDFHLPEFFGTLEFV
jgi:hypothetical protein